MTMRIAIIGTGRMGTNLGQAWARSDHEVVLGSRRPAEREEALERVPGARLVSQAQALEGADVVVLAMPYRSSEPFARAHADQLRDRLVIDISNPSYQDIQQLAGAEVTARAIGPGARVVAAFKTNYYRTLQQPIDPKYGLVRDVLLAGDDMAGKEIVARLAEDMGFHPVDCGGLQVGHTLDVMTRLMIDMDRQYAAGEARTSWKLLT
jgi:NADPH-dependent F420 reductase